MSVQRADPALLGIDSLAVVSTSRLAGACSDSQLLVMLDRSNACKVVGSVALGSRGAYVAVVGSLIVVICSNGNLQAYSNADTPVLQWTYATGSVSHKWLAISGTFILVPGLPGAVLVINTSGALVSRMDAALARTAAGACDGSGYAYLFDGNGSGAVLTVNQSTGALGVFGTFSVPGLHAPVRALIANGNLVVGENSGPSVIVFDITTTAGTPVAISQSTSAGTHLRDVLNDINTTALTDEPVLSLGLPWWYQASAGIQAGSAEQEIGHGRSARISTPTYFPLGTSGGTGGGGAAGTVAFVAGLADGTLRSSTDGVTFTTRTRAAGHPANGISSVVWINGIWYYAMDGGYFATSPDGITWTAGTAIPSGSACLLCYMSAIGRLVAVRASNVATGGTGHIYTSDDLGVTWTDRGLAPEAGVYGNYPYSVATDGTTLILGVSQAMYRTTDAINYTLFMPIGTAHTSSAITAYGLIYSGGQFVAVGFASATTAMISSANGTTWTTNTAPSAWAGGTLYCITLLPSGKWVLGGDTGRTATGTDLNTWTVGSTLANGAFLFGAPVALNIAAMPGGVSGTTLYTTKGDGTFSTIAMTAAIHAICANGTPTQQAPGIPGAGASIGGTVGPKNYSSVTITVAGSFGAADGTFTLTGTPLGGYSLVTNGLTYLVYNSVPGTNIAVNAIRISGYSVSVPGFITGTPASYHLYGIGVSYGITGAVQAGSWYLYANTSNGPEVSTLISGTFTIVSWNP